MDDVDPQLAVGDRVTLRRIYRGWMPGDPEDTGVWRQRVDGRGESQIGFTGTVESVGTLVAVQWDDLGPEPPPSVLNVAWIDPWTDVDLTDLTNIEQYLNERQ